MLRAPGSSRDQVGRQDGGARPAAEEAAREIATAFREQRRVLEIVALRHTGNRADADDLVQSTAARALERAHRYDPGTDVTAWLRRIMFRLFVDGYRRDRGRRLEQHLDECELAAPTADPAPWQEFTLEDVRSVLPCLSARTRAIFELQAGAQLSYEEIAARAGIPVGTVGTRLRRARLRLKTLLQARGPGAPITELPVAAARTVKVSLAVRAA